MKLYVGKTCSEKTDGTREHPFKNIDEARKYLQDNNINETAEVIILEGRYFFSDVIRFSKDDKPAVYRAEEGAEVYFDGGIVIDPGLVKKVDDDAVLEKIIEEDARNFIYEADLSGLDEIGEYGSRGFRHPYIPAPNELFINGKPQKIASYPKAGYFPLGKVIDSGSIPMNGDFSMRGGTFGYDTERGNKWVNAEDAYASGFFANCYADDTIKIEKINPEDKTIKLLNPGLNGLKAVEEHRWKIVNLLEEIGEPGEYFIDRKGKKLYFYPECDPKDALIQISVLTKPMLSFKEASGITFEGIVFENSRGSGVYIEG